MGLGYYSTVERMKMTAPEGAYTGIAKPIVEFGIMPDILTSGLPEQQLEVTFGRKCIEPGQELTPLESAAAPQVRWKGEEGLYYTLMMLDPDPPSRRAPFLKAMLSGLLANVRLKWNAYIACTECTGW